MSSLPGVRSGLLSNPLDGQMLVYDRRTNAVHLLDPTTARVMELLQNRKWTEEELTAELTDSAGASSSAALLELALDELRKADLLDDGVTRHLPLEMSRRDLLRKVTLAGAAAVLIPAIVTLSPSMAYAQTSCLAKKACCNVNADCCSGKCDTSTGSGCLTGPLECH